MDANELKELRELIGFLKENKIAEFDLDRDGTKVRIKFEGTGGGGIDLSQLRGMMASAPAAAAPVAAAAPAGAAPAAPAAAPAAADPEAGMQTVKSPIVGTFYDAPSPGSPPFVKVGDVVEVGQVLCIVEAMKLMNEIESDAAGEVVRQVPTAGQPVEYGQSLFVIKAR